MGQQQSKDELLYQQVSYGNSEGIKALRREGAGLEWIDKEGKTPLILACMNPGLYDVAKTLIELGANVNAYRAGRHAGTPLHHAAKRGLEQTVKLLLSHGANALVMNDDCQTPLDVARVKGFSNVVRAIESHICLFSGWLRELYGPGFLELLAPQLLSRKVWVAVIPCGSRNLRKPFKLELAVYANLQDAQPRTIIALWKANMADPNFSQPDPTVVITDSSSRTRIKLAAAKESDKQQLQWFCNACKGIPQVVQPAFSLNPAPHGIPATAPPSSEDMELAMAINASLQSAVQEIPHHLDFHAASPSNPSTSRINNDGVTSGQAFPNKGSSSGGKHPESSPTELAASQGQAQAGPSSAAATENSTAGSIPSAPPLEDSPEDDGPIQYPSIDNSPLDLTSPPVDTNAKHAEKSDASASSSSCVICLDAPVEGACIPCGHMAGCMSCLNEIKAKNWGCPVCRANIDQVVRLYAV
ncbi:OLC1v1019692C2 [Oldenlandia corymbosa var. corymbosa]|uniref:OLC1v1019692C2 n=2 Tax=Oldenlandia corymbosa var. corymbosa TaxID=529605 RepID=A0AAV1EEI5_OLDCO|nr:OLC1v1019692C2 [Oldenlandia corymbosa var. corymbosa]